MDHVAWTLLGVVALTVTAYLYPHDGPEILIGGAVSFVVGFALGRLDGRKKRA